METTYRTLGVNFTAGKAAVRYWAPLAHTATLQILGDAPQELPLQQQEHGYWTLSTDLLQPGDSYRFKINNDTELPDPASLSQPEGVHGASTAADLSSYPWQDEGWKNIPQEDYIIYELHTGTFTPEGSFEGIIPRLPHLKELGVNAIEIMPVSQFPGERNWGYDGVYPFAVQHSYGGYRGLQQLVDACHSAGIAVILDVVYNHLGPEGNYFSLSAPYFTHKYTTPWGAAINFDDSWCDEVRRYYIENVLMWFRDFHIDALRLDAVHAIRDFSPVHLLREIKLATNQLMRETGRHHYLIAECDLNDTRYINSIEEDGYGMNAQWMDEFHHALRVAAGQEKIGYYSDFNGLEDLALSYRNAYVFTGQYSAHRHRRFGTNTDHCQGQQFVVFSQNHDQTGNRMLGERTSTLVSYEMTKVLAGAIMVAPFIPMLFMGEEYGETNPFLYFVSHGDEDLIAAVRKGRKEEFASFSWQGEAPDPQSADTFNHSKLQWHSLETAPHRTLYQYYKALIAFRKADPVLRHLDKRNLTATASTDQQTLLLHRWHENHHIYCLMNFSPLAQPIPVLPAEAKPAFYSAAAEWGGTVAPSNSTLTTIQPESILIYTT